MAQRLTLHFVPGDSLLHRWDARCKFLGLLTIGITLLQTRMVWLVFDSVVFLGLIAISRLPLRSFLRDFRTWVIFLFVLFLFQACFSEGPRLSAVPWIPVSREGIRLGGLTCWRLGLILGYAVLFTAVTRPRELQDAVIWLLSPVPFIPERRVGLMVSLTLRFFSIILDQAEEVRMAHKARLAEQNRNPFRRTKYLALPIFRRSLLRAEDTTLALAARGYRDDVRLALPGMKLMPLIPVVAFLVLSFVLARLWS